MKFKEQFPSIKTLAKPQIVESPFKEGRLAIAYPYVPDGQWIHQDELQKYCLDREKVKEDIHGSILSMGKYREGKMDYYMDDWG